MRNNQLLPLFLTVVVFLFLSLFLFVFVRFLNIFPLQQKILFSFSLTDVMVGLTIYLKTSIDFALFIGNLMKTYGGVKNRIAIEIGTALGNGLGTCFVLLIWTFFKEVPLLMTVMIFVAALVLFQLAEEGLEEFGSVTWGITVLKSFLHSINSLSSPLLRSIIPHNNTRQQNKKTFLSLLLFSFTIPLLLGLDDFAGYIPLFNIINVAGFSLGVFLGHMLLNASLFASPQLTIRIVKQPVISLLGSIAFIGIAAWGLVEIVLLVTH